MAKFNYKRSWSECSNSSKWSCLRRSRCGVILVFSRLLAGHLQRKVSSLVVLFLEEGALDVGRLSLVAISWFLGLRAVGCSGSCGLSVITTKDWFWIELSMVLGTRICWSLEDPTASFQWLVSSFELQSCTMLFTVFFIYSFATKWGCLVFGGCATNNVSLVVAYLAW